MFALFPISPVAGIVALLAVRIRKAWKDSCLIIPVVLALSCRRAARHLQVPRLRFGRTEEAAWMDNFLRENRAKGTISQSDSFKGYRG
ncbi:MAG: hypothetical protein QXI60_07735 [Thermofilaceae archaeon]